jgi:hypothetical protein
MLLGWREGSEKRDDDNNLFFGMTVGAMIMIPFPFVNPTVLLHRSFQRVSSLGGEFYSW